MFDRFSETVKLLQRNLKLRFYTNYCLNIVLEDIMAYTYSSNDAEASRKEDRAYNALMHEVQQIMAHKESTIQKLQKLEKMIKFAGQKMRLIQSMKAKRQDEGFIISSGWEVQKKQNSKVSSQKTSQKSPHYELNTPKFDELPGEDKEDWHYEEIICIALGVEDLYHTKQNSEGNSSGDKVLECTSESRITPREIKPDYKEDLDKPTKSEPEFQMPKDLIASTTRYELMLQPVPCYIKICQGVNSSKSIDKESQPIAHYVPPGDINIDAISCSVPQNLPVNFVSKPDPSKCIPLNSVTQEICVESSAVDPHILSDYVPSGTIGSSTAICRTNGENPLIWSKCKSVPYTDRPLDKDFSSNMDHFLVLKMFTEDNITSVGNNSSEVNGHCLFFNENGVYKDLRNLPETSMSTKNVVYDLRPMLIFDPGGYVQNANPTGVLQDMICLKFLTIEQLMKEPPQLRKKAFKAQMVTSARIQGVGDEIDRIVCEINQQYADSVRAGIKVITKYIVMRKEIPEMDRVMRLEDHKASRKSVTIYIFDPGGGLSCLDSRWCSTWCFYWNFKFPTTFTRCSRGKGLVQYWKRKPGLKALSWRFHEDMKPLEEGRNVKNSCE